MQKKKENILEKIVKKDYNNELEKILETKKFDSNVKNLLLEILYKIEVAYKDYREVKRDVELQKDYIQRIIYIVENKCDEIKTVKPGTEEIKQLGEKTFFVDKENKKIICYPIERKLLYCISKIDKKEEIIKNKYSIINTTLTDVINVGNNINTVEPLRNFNGWSWSVIKGEIENLECNLIYQNLRILLGNQFLVDWLENEEYLIDYFELMKNKLEESFGEKIQKNFVKLLAKISILIQIDINPDAKDNYENQKRDIENQLEKISDKKKYIETITEEKKQIKLQIKDIETIISNKDKLQEEYKKRNEKLPLNKKIFSMKVLTKMLIEQKENLKIELEEKNKLLNPSKYIEEKTNLQNKLELLEFANLQEMIIKLQKQYLDCFSILIEKAQTKEEIINLVYNLRYYSKIPLTNNEDINENKDLKPYLKNVEEKLLNKAINNKVINENINLQIFEYIMNSKIISLENMYVTLKKNNKNIIIQFSEDSKNEYEEKLEISKEEWHENNVFRSNKNGYRFKLFS